MDTIETIYAKAVQLQRSNPEIQLSIFEICQLAVSGASFSSDKATRKPPAGALTSDELADGKSALASMPMKFTAKEFAERVYCDNPGRTQVVRASALAEHLTGAPSKKSNGRLVFTRQPISPPRRK